MSEHEFFSAVRRVIRTLLGEPVDAAPLSPPLRARLAASLQRQVSAYTTRRAADGHSHLEHPLDVAAYLAHFGVRSFLVVRRLAQAYALEGDSVLDLGAGPGVAGLALLSSRQVDAWTMVEPAPGAVAAARALAEALALPAPRHLAPSVEAVAWGKARYSTVVASLSVSEWPGDATYHAAVLRRACTSLRRGGRLLLVEPALRHSARALGELRALLLAAGLVIEGPCTHQGPCPVLGRRRDYCHGHLRLQVPEDFAALGYEAMRLDLADADFASLVVAAQGRARHPGWRAVGEVRHEKGRDRVFLCGAEGLLECFALTGRSASAPDALRDLRRGDVIALDPPPRGPRHRIDQADALRRCGWLP